MAPIRAPLHYDRPLKNEARRRLFRLAGGPAKRLASLPGPDLLCVQEMWAQGLVDARTDLHLFEYDPSRHRAMCATVESLGMRAYCYDSDIREHEPPRGDVFDLLNLDMEEGFSPNLGLMLERWALAGTLADDVTLFLTLTQRSRNGRVAAFWRWFEPIYASDTYTGLRNNLRRHQLHINETCDRQIALLATALYPFDLHVEQAEDYADGWNMNMLRVRLRRRQDAEPTQQFRRMVSTFYAETEIAKRNVTCQPRRSEITNYRFPTTPAVITPEIWAAILDDLDERQMVLDEDLINETCPKQVEYKRRAAKMRDTKLSKLVLADREMADLVQSQIALMKAHHEDIIARVEANEEEARRNRHRAAACGVILNTMRLVGALRS